LRSSDSAWGLFVFGHPIPGPDLSARRRTRRATAFLVAALAAGSLAACETFTTGSYLSCPSVAILADTELVMRFDGPGPSRSFADVAVEAGMHSLSGTCQYSRERVETEVAFDVIARRGASSSAMFVDLPYFVAVFDAEGGLLSKQVFTAHLEFPPGEAEAGRQERVAQTVYLAPNQTPRAFEVLIGFQLTQEEFETNLARGGG
jgi:hypothetical protein